MKAGNRTKLNAMIGQLETLIADIQAIHDEEEIGWDGKSERWQEGDKGQEAKSKIDSLESAIQDMDSAKTSIEEASQE